MKEEATGLWRRSIRQPHGITWYAVVVVEWVPKKWWVVMKTGHGYTPLHGPFATAASSHADAKKESGEQPTQAELEALFDRNEEEVVVMPRSVRGVTRRILSPLPEEVK